MTQVEFGDLACRRALAILDSYIDGEMPAVDTAALGEHFKGCPKCALEAAERRRVRVRLRTAVREIQVPAALEGRIRAGLQAPRRPQSWGPLMAIAAALALCVGSAIAYQVGALRLTKGSQDSYIAMVSSRLAKIMRIGLGDHIHCAVFRKQPATVRNLPPQYRELAPIVEQRVPKEFALTIAHECRYQGRKFVHLTFKSDSNLLSVVIARKQDGEGFQSELLPALTEAGLPMYAAATQRFQIAGFPSAGYLVYMVSDLPARRNLDLMMALGPVVDQFLKQMGS